jgi:AraC-like DNA-binding protein
MLLAGPEWASIKEIAYTVGYADTRELDRHFRRATGMTPSEYRRGSPPSL